MATSGGDPSPLAHLLGHPPSPNEGDGFGQSLRDDLRYWRLARRLRRRTITWRPPTRAEQDAILADVFLGRFGDGVHALAQVDDLACVVLENDWFGFPDPNRYVLFAMRARTVAIAADFNAWPACWTIAAGRSAA